MKTKDDVLQVLHGLKNEVREKFKVKDFRTEAKRDIKSTRHELLQRFAAAPYIRSSWLSSSVLPAFIASLGMAWWLWSDTGNVWVSVAVLGSFVLFTAMFLLRSPMMGAKDSSGYGRSETTDRNEPPNNRLPTASAPLPLSAAAEAQR